MVADRPLGRQGHVLRHRGGEAIGVPAQLPACEGIAGLGGVGGGLGFLACLDDLLGIDPVQLPVLIGHGDRLAVGVGDVGLVIDLSAGVHGLAAELGVLFQSQPVIECAAGGIALRADGFVKAAAGDVAPKVFSYVPIQVIIRDCRGDAAVEAAAPDIARAVDIAGEDRGRLPVRVVDGVGDLDLSILIEPVRSHIHRALRLAAVDIEEAAGMVGDQEVVKIHIDRSAVFDVACLGILFGGRAARDVGVLPQLQLGIADQGQAAAAFACLAVLDAAVGDLETVYLRNMPPSHANYVQRAGRAGRSIHAAAYSLTYSKLSSHDFTYFEHPERMISGKIGVPLFSISNEKVILRHVFAVALSDFFALNSDVHNSNNADVLVNQNGYERLKAHLLEIRSR